MPGGGFPGFLRSRMHIVNPLARALCTVWSVVMDRDTQNTQGTPGDDEEADTASGGAPEKPATTDENGMPVDNPSGG